MTQVCAPRQASRIDRRARLLDRLGRVAQRPLAGLVGADLVARHAVLVERQRHRRRPPVAVVAVLVALPLADAALDSRWKRVGGVALCRGWRGRSGRRPTHTRCPCSSWAKTALWSATTSTDRTRGTVGVGVGLAVGGWAGVTARTPAPTTGADRRLVGIEVRGSSGGGLATTVSGGAASIRERDRPGTGRPWRPLGRTGGRHPAYRSRSHRRRRGRSPARGQ